MFYFTDFAEKLTNLELFVKIFQNFIRSPSSYFSVHLCDERFTIVTALRFIEI